MMSLEKYSWETPRIISLCFNNNYIPNNVNTLPFDTTPGHRILDYTSQISGEDLPQEKIDVEFDIFGYVNAPTPAYNNLPFYNNAPLNYDFTSHDLNQFLNIPNGNPETSQLIFESNKNSEIACFADPSHNSFNNNYCADLINQSYNPSRTWDSIHFSNKENNGGLINFRLIFDAENPNNEASFSQKRKKLYVSRSTYTFKFGLNTDYMKSLLQHLGIDSVKIRATPMFKDFDKMSLPVRACYLHENMDSLGRSQTRKHFVISGDICSTHENNHDRFSVSIPINIEHFFEDTIDIPLQFVCFSSCSGGINKRNVQLVFTLETSTNIILAQTLLDLRVCAAVLRDFRKDEERIISASYSTNEVTLLRGRFNNKKCQKSERTLVSNKSLIGVNLNEQTASKKPRISNNISSMGNMSLNNISKHSPLSTISGDTFQESSSPNSFPAPNYLIIQNKEHHTLLSSILNKLENSEKCAEHMLKDIVLPTNNYNNHNHINNYDNNVPIPNKNSNLNEQNDLFDKCEEDLGSFSSSQRLNFTQADMNNLSIDIIKRGIDAYYQLIELAKDLETNHKDIKLPDDLKEINKIPPQHLTSVMDNLVLWNRDFNRITQQYSFSLPSSLSSQQLKQSQNNCILTDDNLLIYRYGFINENSDLDNLQPAINVLKSEELIYYIDSIVVIYSPWLHTQRYFLQHINHISCLTVDYEGTMVATGERHDNQEIIQVIIWDPIAMQIIYKIGENILTRIVLSLSFSRNSNYLASLDNSNDHVMLLWDLKKSKVLARISLNKMAIRRIIYARAFQIFTIGRFILNVWKINIFLDTFEELNQISYEKLITLSENSTEIFEFTSVVYDQNKEILITGDSLNNITMWNLNLKIIRQIFQTHESCVTALFFNFNKLISGGKDGYLKYWNHLTCDLLAVIKIPYRDGGIAAIQLLNNNIYLGTDTNAILKVAFKTDMTQKNFLEDDNMFSTFELNTDNYILTASHCKNLTDAHFANSTERYLCTSSLDGTIIVLDTINHTIVRKILIDKISIICFDINIMIHMIVLVTDEEEIIGLKLLPPNEIANKNSLIMDSENVLTALKGKIKHVFRLHFMKEKINAIQFSPDSKFIAAFSELFNLFLIELVNDNEIDNIQPFGVLQTNFDCASILVFAIVKALLQLGLTNSLSARPCHIRKSTIPLFLVYPHITLELAGAHNNLNTRDPVPCYLSTYNDRDLTTGYWTLPENPALLRGGGKSMEINDSVL
ncbi:unnamed protein product [Gordionus sp. m RMFG-2023]